jgi:CelD/BcsL family acetyltransferase involved in cellulose biosynthesis
MTQRYDIERLSSPRQLQGLKESWDGLTERISESSFFMSWSWIWTWWSHFRDGKELWLLTARDREGNLAGIAPLMCSRHRCGPMILRHLSFIGSGIAAPVHMDFLVGEAESEELTAALLQYLITHDQEWDILDLQALREGSSLKRQIVAAGGSWLEREPLKCSFVTLPDSWEVFRNKHMNGKLRKTIRYYERRLEKDFPGRVVSQAVTEEVELDPALDFLIRNSRLVFSRAEVASAFVNEDYCKFYREMVQRAFREGFLRFFLLKVDNRIIAVQHCFCFKGIFYGYQTAYDPDWRKYSPGQQLLAHVFREAIKEKAREIDMSHGETDYKARWASDERNDCHLLYVRNRRARLWLFCLRAFDRLVDIARRLLPVGLRRRIGRFLRVGTSEI